MAKNSMQDNLNKNAKSHEELLLVARDGDSSAFEQIAKNYENVINAIALSFNVPASDRDDLRQEGLIALYRAVLRYDKSMSGFSTFASVCIKRAMLTFIRDHVSKVGKDGSTVTEISLDESFDDILADDEALCPEEQYISRETVKNLRNHAMKQLSDFEKCIFLMYLEEMTSTEIAESMGRSKKSVDNALCRIRKKLSSGK
ncbi:MAG: sigma-70 family RNA polymerase sigma factor [Clostridia bacterium]|nr:sigma-70 family RNA polymerase sigma factor [Clostridia bacterium]